MSLLACGCSYDDARRALVAQVAVLSRRLADSMQREEDTRRRAAESVEAYEGRLVVLQAQVDDLLAESVQIRADSELLVSVSTSSWLASRGRWPRVTASCAMLQAQVAAQQTVARERLLMADHVASATAASREQVASEVAQMRQELEAAQQQVAKRDAALAAARRNYRSKEAVLVADAKKLSTVRGGVGACVRCAIPHTAASPTMLASRVCNSNCNKLRASWMQCGRSMPRASDRWPRLRARLHGYVAACCGEYSSSDAAVASPHQVAVTLWSGDGPRGQTT